MNRLLILATSLLASQAYAYSQSDISGTWECMIPGRTYTMTFTPEGKYESHAGSGSDYSGTYSINGIFLLTNYRNVNYQSSNLSSSYQVNRVTSNQLVLEADGKMIPCIK